MIKHKDLPGTKNDCGECLVEKSLVNDVEQGSAEPKAFQEFFGKFLQKQISGKCHIAEMLSNYRNNEKLYLE